MLTAVAGVVRPDSRGYIYTISLLFVWNKGLVQGGIPKLQWLENIDQMGGTVYYAMLVLFTT